MRMDLKKLALGIGTAAALAGCAGGPAALAQTTSRPPAAEPGGNVALAPGQEVQVAGRDLTVRYRQLVSDSRCKPGRQCFVAGEAVVALVLTEPGRGEHTSVQLHTGRQGPDSTTFAGTTVKLAAVDGSGNRILVRFS
ncbi:hypothetical protein H5411_29715 [Amycolatopsis echigonensis]|uniref:Lipoprotein n=2 Tax=Amycolatopsis echigonensis TaxID=2576905 RepID=A0A8E1W435_9PSEU|nr:hypothetical protein [Amycolatopsis echigonensis]